MSGKDLKAALLAEVARDEKLKHDHKQAILRERQEIFHRQALEEKEELLSAQRVQKQIRERAEERAGLEKANRELQAYFVKADAADRISVMDTYNLLYDLNQEAALTKTKEQFTKIVEVFGFPYSEFVYTEEEKSGLPLMLMDRESMNTFLKMGLWPFKKDPLTDLVDSLKTLNEPQEASVSVENAKNAMLLELIKTDPFIFSNLGKMG